MQCHKFIAPLILFLVGLLPRRSGAGIWLIQKESVPLQGN